MEKVKVLIFDLDNTLINYGGVNRRAWEISVHKAMSIYTLPSLLHFKNNKIFLS